MSCWKSFRIFSSISLKEAGEIVNVDSSRFRSCSLLSEVCWRPSSSRRPWTWRSSDSRACSTSLFSATTRLCSARSFANSLRASTSSLARSSRERIAVWRSDLDVAEAAPLEGAERDALGAGAERVAEVGSDRLRGRVLASSRSVMIRH
jgi:hypothetical protein